MHNWYFGSAEFFYLPASTEYESGFFTTWPLVEKRNRGFDPEIHTPVIVSRKTGNKLRFIKKDSFAGGDKNSLVYKAYDFQEKLNLHDHWETLNEPQLMHLEKINIVIYSVIGRKFSPDFQEWIEKQ